MPYLDRLKTVISQAVVCDPPVSVAPEPALSEPPPVVADKRAQFVEAGWAVCVHLHDPADQELIQWARATKRYTPPRVNSVWHDPKNEARAGERFDDALRRYIDWLESSPYPRRIIGRLEGRVMSCQCKAWICTMKLLCAAFNRGVPPVDSTLLEQRGDHNKKKGGSA